MSHERTQRVNTNTLVVYMVEVHRDSQNQMNPAIIHAEHSIDQSTIHGRNIKL